MTAVPTAAHGIHTNYLKKRITAYGNLPHMAIYRIWKFPALHKGACRDTASRCTTMAQKALHPMRSCDRCRTQKFPESPHDPMEWNEWRVESTATCATNSDYYSSSTTTYTREYTRYLCPPCTTHVMFEARRHERSHWGHVTALDPYATIVVKVTCIATIMEDAPP